jgi:hypothetical protein
MQSLRNLLGHLAVPLLLVLALVAFTPSPALAQSAPLALAASRQSPSVPSDVVASFGVVEREQAVLSPTTSLMQELTIMRAKMQVSAVEKHSEASETVRFRAVSGTDPYGPNGESEDNTFARYTPSGDCSLMISNPDLIGQHEVGQKFYVDFTPAN